MCILFVTTEHPDYHLIALSNRDEDFRRATAPAAWNNDILSPRDLVKAEHGTWIAVSKTGRISVLLNVQEISKYSETVSRGVFATDYVTSHEPDMAKWFDHLTTSANKAGGFNLVCGNLTNHPSLAIATNRGDKPVETLGSGTFCISNAVRGIDWPKTILGEKLLRNLLNVKDQHQLIEDGFGILSTNTLTDSERANPQPESLRKSIFIPRLQLGDEDYGTRTQTVFLLDKKGHAQYIERDVNSGERTVFRFDVDIDKQL